MQTLNWDAVVVFNSSSTVPLWWHRHKLSIFYFLVASLSLSVGSRSDWRGMLRRNVTQSPLLVKVHNSASVLSRADAHFQSRGFCGWKRALLLSFPATVKQSRVDRFCSAVVLRPCGPPPPVLGFISEVSLAAASEATSDWRFSNLFILIKRGKKNHLDSAVLIPVQ